MSIVSLLPRGSFHHHPCHPHLRHPQPPRFLCHPHCHCLHCPRHCPWAARLLSADAGAVAASRPPVELLLPLVALYFIMADCYVVASAPVPSFHCHSRRHRCHHFMIVTAHPHLRRNPLKRKKRQKKSIFIYGKKNEFGSNFQQIQICNNCSQKQKKNYGRHPVLTLFK